MSKSNKIWVPGKSILRGYVASELKVIEGENEKGAYRLVKFRLNEFPDKPIPYTPVIAPAARGEWAEQNLVEGDYIEVNGKMSQFSKEDEQTGELKQRFELNANFIRMLEEAPEEQPVFNPALKPEDVDGFEEMATPQQAYEECDDTLAANLYEDKVPE